MESKIRLKYGTLEIEYEGNESFIKDQLPNLLQSISDLFGNPVLSSPEILPETPIEDIVSGQTVDLKIEGTTNTIAAKLNVKTGPELIMAAAAQLIFVEGKDKFHRKDLIANMQSATTYYKKSYLDNLTGYLDRLVKTGKITEQTKDVYAIPAEGRKSMEAILVK